jgi:uncharacterized protein
MKCTMSITQKCNLRCSYCYLHTHDAVMSPDLARATVDFIYRQTPSGEKIDLGFFGGEPLTEFGLLRQITEYVVTHPDYDLHEVELSLVSNGTIFTPEIAAFVKEYDVSFCVSCDGPPPVQNRFRTFPGGRKSAAIVEGNICRAREELPNLMVNAVYRPETVRNLPEAIDYFSGLGIRRIHINPDYSASWSRDDLAFLHDVYGRIARKYIDFHLAGTPHFINLVDGKLLVILRQGYRTTECCKMGKGEFAFTPSGKIYPCERLIGDDVSSEHCIGDIYAGLDFAKLRQHCHAGQEVNAECLDCSLNAYCMNWCGCSNYFATGYYNRVSPFHCASERAAITAAFQAFEILDQKLGATFHDYLSGGGWQ